MDFTKVVVLVHFILMLRKKAALMRIVPVMSVTPICATRDLEVWQI